MITFLSSSLTANTTSSLLMHCSLRISWLILTILFAILTNSVNNIDKVEDIARDSIDHDQVQSEQQKTIPAVLEDVMHDLTSGIWVFSQALFYNQ